MSCPRKSAVETPGSPMESERQVVAQTSYRLSTTLQREGLQLRWSSWPQVPPVLCEKENIMVPSLCCTHIWHCSLPALTVGQVLPLLRVSCLLTGFWDAIEKVQTLGVSADHLQSAMWRQIFIPQHILLYWCICWWGLLIQWPPYSSVKECDLELESVGWIWVLLFKSCAVSANNINTMLPSFLTYNTRTIIAFFHRMMKKIKLVNTHEGHDSVPSRNNEGY